MYDPKDSNSLSRAVSIAQGVEQPHNKHSNSSRSLYRQGFYEAKRMIVAALEAEQKRIWDSQIIK